MHTQAQIESTVFHNADPVTVTKHRIVETDDVNNVTALVTVGWLTAERIAEVIKERGLNPADVSILSRTFSITETVTDGATLLAAEFLPGQKVDFRYGGDGAPERGVVSEVRPRDTDETVTEYLITLEVPFDDSNIVLAAASELTRV